MRDQNTNIPVLGRIPFLVCAPFFTHFPQMEWVFKDGLPSQQNTWLKEGIVDASPSSAFEYARNPHLYYILPGICTGATTSVGSVLLLANVPIEECEQIWVTGASETSVALLQVYFSEYLRIPLEITSSREEAQACLFIGDEALTERKKNWAHCYDLAELWFHWKQTPFVFGLWMVRRETFENYPDWCNSLKRTLNKNISVFFENIDDSVALWNEQYPSGVGDECLKEYYQRLEYTLQEGQQKALLQFFALLTKTSLIEEEPLLRFLPESIKR